MEKFFEPATFTALTSGIGALTSLFGGGGRDAQIKAQALENEKNRTFQAAENQATRAQRSQELELSQRSQAARQRAEALDRIIGTFQQGLLR